MCAARHVAPTEHAVATTARTAAPTSVRHALRPAGRRIGHPQRASGRPEDWPSTPVRRGCHRSPLAMHARARVAAFFALRRPPSRPQSPHRVRRLLPRGWRCCRPGRGVGRCAPRRSVWGRNQTGLSGALLLARRRPPAGRLSPPPDGWDLAGTPSADCPERAGPSGVRREPLWGPILHAQRGSHNRIAAAQLTRTVCGCDSGTLPQKAPQRSFRFRTTCGA